LFIKPNHYKYFWEQAMKSNGFSLPCFLAGFLLLSSSAMTTIAFAQGTDQERSACIGDAFEFCGAEIPDVSKIEACLAQKKQQLSPACRAEFTPVQRTKLRPEHLQRR
jgi:hypothetical protein